MNAIRPLRIGAPLLCALAGLLAGASGRVAAQEERGVQVEPVTQATNNNPPWLVRVRADHADGIYKIGEEMKVYVKSEKKGFLYLIYFSADDKKSILFPNKVQTENEIPANAEIEVPSPKSRFKLRVTEPVGKEALMAIVTLEPLKSLALEEMTKGDVTELNVDKLKGVMVEVLGVPTHGNIGDNKQKLRLEKPRQYLEKTARYAEHHIFIQVVKDKTPVVRTKQKRLGIFVGVSQYQDPGIRKLRCAHTDAENMAAAMQKDGGLTADPVVLTNEKATLKNIEKAIHDAAVATRPGDEVFIYWSGHGGRCADTTGSESDGFNEFLVPYDGKLDDIDTIRTTMLMDKTFGRWVQELDGRKVVVLLDACHAGGQAATPTKGLSDNRFSKDLTNDQFRPFFFSSYLDRVKDIGQKEAAVLASSRAAQVSFERRDGKMSVMTFFMIQQLKGAGGKVSIQDAAEYLKKEVPAYVKEEFPGATQTPVFFDMTTPPVYLKP
jgi:hypothetical protein